MKRGTQVPQWLPRWLRCPYTRLFPTTVLQRDPHMVELRCTKWRGHPWHHYTTMGRP